MIEIRNIIIITLLITACNQSKSVTFLCNLKVAHRHKNDSVKFYKIQITLQSTVRYLFIISSFRFCADSLCMFEELLMSRKSAPVENEEHLLSVQVQ